MSLARLQVDPEFEKRFAADLKKFARASTKPNNAHRNAMQGIITRATAPIRREIKQEVAGYSRTGDFKRSLRNKRLRGLAVAQLYSPRIGKGDRKTTFQKYLALEYGLTGSRGRQPSRPGKRTFNRDKEKRTRTMFRIVRREYPDVLEKIWLRETRRRAAAAARRRIRA